MPTQSISQEDRASLLEVARASISHGLTHRRPLAVDPDTFADGLARPGASFITLRIEGQLRGCIGRMEATGPLVRSIAQNAYAAAFEDPRFDPLTEPEYARIDVHVSVLTEPAPMRFKDEGDLLRQLRPGVDGLVLETGRCRGTFLPAVWETLTEPKHFLDQLKVKAGLHPDAWPEDVRVLRYTCESFEG
tara:strand:+ start:516 stop:1085 length:570 start_codon:yes stop_codon:yes gene_type:complete